MKQLYFIFSCLLAVGLVVFSSCESLDTENLNNPPRDQVLASGSDLSAVIGGGYISWWQGIHDVHPANALSITGDTYGVSWGNFGGRRMGEEPRAVYNNRPSESADYKQVNEDPWFGCLSSASTANDILIALSNGITIDNGGDGDKSMTAAALFLRGVSRGYLGIIFDKSFLVDETTDLAQTLEFVPYKGMIDGAVADLEAAAAAASGVGDGFSHPYFNGVALTKDQFIALCHSYAAKFLIQWPRTVDEAAQTDWTAALNHASQGIDFDFAPVADGGFWFSYQRYAYANTGQGGFWNLVDMRILSAIDPGQPSRYPEVVAKGEAPIVDSMFTDQAVDLRTGDFIYIADHGGMPIDRGEWHFSHYKHNRNINDPSWAGDGSSFGPMPTFMKADNDMLLAEANMRLGNLGAAIDIINAGTRTSRGGLDPLDAGASADEIEYAILYERAVELLGTAPFNMWMDRRRIGPRLPFDGVDDLGGLQLQTPANLPVPADELGVLEQDFYNFGGPSDPQGIDPIF